MNVLGGLASEKSIRNREDLIRKLKDGERTSPYERVVSFDVEALFPGIRAKEALLYLLDVMLEEIENNGELPIQDLRIIGGEKRIPFDIYRKFTHTTQKGEGIH